MPLRPRRPHAFWASLAMCIAISGCSDEQAGSLAPEFEFPIPGVSGCYTDCSEPSAETDPPAGLEVTPPELANRDYISTLLVQRFPSALRCCARGTAFLLIHTRPSGKPSDVRLMESTGFPPLDSLAVNAMTAAEFIPARVGADPVSLWVGMPVTFQ